MSNAKKVTQINLMLPDRVGLLAEITAALGKANINLSAICAYSMEGQATFTMITDDNEKALQALAGMGLEAKEYPMVAVDLPDRPGELQKVAQKIADAGINILYMYGTTGSGDSAVAVLATSDTDKAIEVINT